VQKATRFSKTEVVFVAVNSIITKLFLIFPATLVQIGKSASIIMSLYISALGYVILYFIARLYRSFCGQTIIEVTGYVFGKYARLVYSIMISATFIVINGLFLRCVSESINMSLMPDTDVNIISLIFIIGVCIAVFSGLKAIIRCHAVIVPVTLCVCIVLFLGSISSFDYNKIYPIFGDGLSSFALGSLLCSYFTDFFVIMLLMPYMDNKIKLRSVVNQSVVISSIVLIAIISAVLLAVENSTIIPVFKLGQNFKVRNYTPRLESVFTAAWFLSFYLNFSLLLYYSCKLFSNGKRYKTIIIPLGFIAFAISIIPQNIYDVNKWLDYLSFGRLFVFMLLPAIILSCANIKLRRKKR